MKTSRFHNEKQRNILAISGIAAFILAFALILVGATGLAFFLIILGVVAGFSVYWDQSKNPHEHLVEEEREVLECLRETANRNIEIARQNALVPAKERVRALDGLYDSLETRFGTGFVSDLSDEQITWIRYRYQSMIDAYTRNNLRLERSREHLRNAISPINNRLESYFRGAFEIAAPTAPRPDDRRDATEHHVDTADTAHDDTAETTPLRKREKNSEPFDWSKDALDDSSENNADENTKS